MTRKLLGLILGFTLFVSVSPVALANHPDAATTLTIQKFGANSNQVKGSVKSPDEECTKARTVNLFRSQSGTDPLVGTTTSGSNGHGAYEFGAQPPGKYYSRVEEEQRGAYPHERTCGAAQSKTIKIN